MQRRWGQMICAPVEVVPSRAYVISRQSMAISGSAWPTSRTRSTSRWPARPRSPQPIITRATLKTGCPARQEGSRVPQGLPHEQKHVPKRPNDTARTLRARTRVLGPVLKPESFVRRVVSGASDAAVGGNRGHPTT